jgi:hypothetical protein
MSLDFLGFGAQKCIMLYGSGNYFAGSGIWIVKFRD